MPFYRLDPHAVVIPSYENWYLSCGKRYWSGGSLGWLESISWLWNGGGLWEARNSRHGSSLGSYADKGTSGERLEMDQSSTMDPHTQQSETPESDRPRQIHSWQGRRHAVEKKTGTSVSQGILNNRSIVLSVPVCGCGAQPADLERRLQILGTCGTGSSGWVMSADCHCVAIMAFVLISRCSPKCHRQMTHRQ